MPLAQKVIGVGISGATAAGSAMAVALAPYDSVLSDAQNGPAIATVTFPATFGKRWLLSMLCASLVNLAGLASENSVLVSYGGTYLFRQYLGVTGVGGTGMNINLSGLALIAPMNTAMTITFNGTGVSILTSISAGAYLI